MLTNSTRWVFSIIHNVKKRIKDGKTPIYRICTTIHFNKSIEKDSYVVQCAKRIFNDIENGYYSLEDFVIALCYEYIWNNNVNLTQIKKEKIQLIKKLFTKEQLEKDKKFILELNKRVKLKGIKEYLKVNEKGTSIIYELIKNRKISPIFFLFVKRKGLTEEKKNVILNEEYLRFIRITTIINDLF